MLRPLPRGPHRMSRAEVAASQRARLLAAVTGEVAERGYAATTVTGVTRRAGVSPNVFYQHFSSKEACFLAAYEVFVGRIVAELGHEAAGGEWEGFVSRALRSYLQLLDEEPVAARAFLLEIEGAGEEPRRRLDRALEAVAGLLRQRHAELARRDGRMELLPERVYLGLVHGIRALACRALRDRPGECLPGLFEDLRRWITVTVAGSRR